MITAKQLIQQNRKLPLVAKDSMVFDAVMQMDREEVGALLVIENNRLIGVISERDYTRKVVLRKRISKTTRVEEIMTKDVFSIQDNCSVDECMKLMHSRNIRHLPVLKGEEVIGILSILDVLGCLVAERDETLDQLHSYVTAETDKVARDIFH